MCDSGFYAVFFVKHFTKNREEMRARHCNLLFNQQHAIDIVMELYNSFWESKGTTTEVGKFYSEKF